MTPHISAELGQIAKTVLLAGDPLRAKYIADNYLTDAKLVSSVRNVYFFTGTYKGKIVTVGASGMGLGSMGIYSYELFDKYGVQRIVRIGSSGSYKKELCLRDLVLVTESWSEFDMFAEKNLKMKVDLMKPDEELNEAIRRSAESKGVKLVEGRCHSTDVFYDAYEVSEIIEKSKAMCVEMESFALFTVAKRLGKQAACLLTISDSLVTWEQLSPEERQTSFKNMMEVALGIL